MKSNMRETRRDFRPLRECWRDWAFAGAVVVFALLVGSCLELLAFALFDLPPGIYLR